MAALAGATLALGMWLPAPQALLHFEAPPLAWTLAVLGLLTMMSIGLTRLAPRATGG